MSTDYWQFTVRFRNIGVIPADANPSGSGRLVVELPAGLYPLAYPLMVHGAFARSLNGTPEQPIDERDFDPIRYSKHHPSGFWSSDDPDNTIVWMIRQWNGRTAVYSISVAAQLRSVSPPAVALSSAEVTSPGGGD